MSNGDWYYDDKGHQVAVDWNGSTSVYTPPLQSSTSYTCTDFVGNHIRIGSKVVYIGSYSSGNLTTGVVTAINYKTNKVTIPDEKYPINADEVVVYERIE